MQPQTSAVLCTGTCATRTFTSSQSQIYLLQESPNWPLTFQTFRGFCLFNFFYFIFTQLFIQNDHKLEQYGEFLPPPPTTPPCENNYKSVHVDLETRYLSADNNIMHIPTSQLHVRPFYTTVNIFSIFYRYLLVPLARSKTCSASVHGYVYNYTSILSTKRTAKTCRHKNVMGGGGGGQGGPRHMNMWTQLYRKRALYTCIIQPCDKKSKRFNLLSFSFQLLFFFLFPFSKHRQTDTAEPEHLVSSLQPQLLSTVSKLSSEYPIHSGFLTTTSSTTQFYPKYPRLHQVTVSKTDHHWNQIHEYDV